MSNYEDLRKAIEQELKHSFTTPSDFKWLADKIEERTHERLSISTLMRLWGYVSGVSPRKGTLDILARFLGYTGYDDFCRINRHIGRRSTRWISACWKHLHLSRRWVVGIVVSLALLVAGYFISYIPGGNGEARLVSANNLLAIRGKWPCPIMRTRQEHLPS